MKKTLLGLGIITVSLVITSCNSNPQNWTKEQKETVHKKCVDLLTDKGDAEGAILDFCDCTTEKTVKKYTYEESQDLTDDELKKLLEDCSYQW